VITVLKEIVSPDGLRKAVIYRREDGSFGFGEEVFSQDPREMSWFPSRFQRADSFYPDAETAEREARSRLAWLARMDEEV
jgi:hypothetical protein